MTPTDGRSPPTLAGDRPRRHTFVMVIAERKPLEPLAAQVQFLGTLARVLPWGLSVQPQWLVVDVVVQDEYTHDIILGAAGDPRALVLDCT